MHNEPIGAKAELLARAHALRRQYQCASRLESLGDRGAILIVALLTVVGVDVMWPASVSMRGAMSLLLLSLFMWAALGARGGRRARNLTLARAVGAAETATGRSLGQGRIAVELVLETPTHDPLCDALCQRAIERGLAAVRLLDLSAAVDSSRARFALLRVSAMLAVVTLFAALAPNIIGAEAPRLIDPMGDHPPYSRTRLVLEVESADVRVGDNVNVSAIVTGKAVESLDLALEMVDGEPIDRIAMRRIHAAHGDSGVVFQKTVRNLRYPMRMYAVGATSRSRRTLIEPAPKPRLYSASMTITSPAYTRRDALTLPLPTSVTPDVLVGSTVELRADCSISIHHADAPGSFTSAVDHATAMARWRIKSPGTSWMKLDAVTSEGFGLDEPVGVMIHRVTDLPPSIAVHAPAVQHPDSQFSQVFAPTDAAISIEAIARDDVRIQDVRIEWSASDPGLGRDIEQSWTALPISVFAAPDGVRAQSTLSGESLDVAPGQSIWVRVVAQDNRPGELGGAQEAVAGPIEIHFVTDEALAQLDADEMDGVIVLHSDGRQTGDTAFGESARSSFDEASSLAQPQSKQNSAKAGGPSSASRARQNKSDGGNPQSSAGSATAGAGQHSSEPKSNSPADSPDGQFGAGELKKGRGQEGSSSSTGGIRALRWGSGHTPPAPFALKPDQLRKLSERHRELASRYYLLLNNQATAVPNHDQTGNKP